MVRRLIKTVAVAWLAKKVASKVLKHRPHRPHVRPSKRAAAR